MAVVTPIAAVLSVGALLVSGSGAVPAGASTLPQRASQLAATVTQRIPGQCLDYEDMVETNPNLATLPPGADGTCTIDGLVVRLVVLESKAALARSLVNVSRAGSSECQRQKRLGVSSPLVVRGPNWLITSMFANDPVPDRRLERWSRVLKARTFRGCAS